MSTWGVNIYQSDVAEDVKYEYTELLRKGKSDDEALQIMLDNNQLESNDYDDAPHFWFALADTQWRLGRLDEDVKKNAIKLIDEGRSIKEWEEVSPKKAQQRAKVLKELKLRLLSEQPERKKVSVHRFYKCEWRIGDVYAYPLLGELAKERGLFGRYILLHKVGEHQWGEYHIVPVVRVKLSCGEELPKSSKEFDELEYVQTGVVRFEDRIYPMNFSLTPEENQFEIMNLRCETDEYGLLRVFLMRINTTSKRAMPNSLIFVGNFSNVLAPEAEFIPRGGAQNIPYVWWKDIETGIVKRYFNYNKKESKIYEERS